MAKKKKVCKKCDGRGHKLFFDLNPPMVAQCPECGGSGLPQKKKRK